MENNVIYDAIQSVAEQTEYNGDGIDALLNGRIVKSVQRGNADIHGSGYVKIPISHVNIAKSILHVVPQLQSGNFNVFVYITDDGNNIEVVNYEYSSGIVTSGYFSWQVIEFY